MISGPGAFNAELGEFILDYEDVRTAAEPVDAVLEFLQETYSVAAERAEWDRSALDRTDAVARAVRVKAPQHSAISQPAARRDGREDATSTSGHRR